jgi:hypothetical protein
MVPQPAYSFSFTAASLRPELVGTIVEYFFRLGSWEETKRAVLAANALQARSPASSIRMERELRQRLQKLTPDQLRLTHRSTTDVRTSLAWLAAVKHSAFLFEFPSEVMRAKLEFHDVVLRASDYERFISDKSPHHPELVELTESSSTKIRRVLLLMLREIGLLTAGSDLGTIQRAVIPPAVEKVIRSDDAKWLAAFLISDSEIGNKKDRRQ